MSATFPEWREWMGLRPLERVAPQIATRTPDLYKLEEDYTRTIMVAEVPQGVSIGWLAGFLKMGGDVSASIQALPYGDQEALRLLRMRRTQHITEQLSRVKRGQLDDPTEAYALASATATEQQIINGHAKLFKTLVTLVLRAKTIPELAQLEHRVMARLRTSKATAWALTNEHEDAFQDSLPLMRHKLGRDQPLDTTSLAFSFPFDASNVGMPAGPIWGYTQTHRVALRYDQRNRTLGVEAPHVAIVGPTGVGKSVLFTAVLVEQLIGAGPNVPDQTFLVDPKGDYRGLARYFNGLTVSWSIGWNEVTINALQLYPERHFNEHIQDVLGLLALATTTKEHPMSPEDHSFWEVVLRDAYRAYGIEGHVERTWSHKLVDGKWVERANEDYPTLGDAYRLVSPEQQWDSPRLAGLLRPWAAKGGTFAGVFGRHTNTDLRANRLVVFDLESLTHSEDALGRLQPMATYLIALWVWGLARADRRPRILGTDEVGVLLDRPATARFLGNALALGRHYGLSIFHMNQGWRNYKSAGEAGEKILLNTPTRVLLAQPEGENLEELARDCRLTEHQRHALGRLRKGVPGQWGSEALMVTPRGNEIVEVVPPPEVFDLLPGGKFYPEPSPLQEVKEWLQEQEV